MRERGRERERGRGRTLLSPASDARDALRLLRGLDGWSDRVMKVTTTSGLDLGGHYRRRSISIINKREAEILEARRKHRRVMSPTDSASRGADEEDKGG